MDNDTPFLPQDIVTFILKRLPIKSLIRFQCVCKHWKNLFKTQSFIEDHLYHHSSHLNPSLLIAWSSFGCNGWHWHLDTIDCNMKFYEFQTAPLPLIKCSHVRIIGSINGLLCLEIYHSPIPYSHSLLLWNPATRELRHVRRTIGPYIGWCHFGFGFIPTINDYKIVRISKTNFDNRRVEVYSLNIGLWKEIELGNLEGLHINYDSVSVNGVVFWFGCKMRGGDGDVLIVSFDLAKEVFGLLTIPAAKPSIETLKLTLYENKLAVLSTNHVIQEQEYTYCIKLWVMVEGTYACKERWNLTKSWVKNYTNNNPDSYLMHLNAGTIWRNMVVCIHKYDVENYETDLYFFNITTDEFKSVVVRGRYYDILFNNYVESLVSVGNIHIEEPLS